MLFAVVFVSGAQCAASASEQASSRPMLVAQRSPFSSPHSSHSSPFSSPCSHNSDFSPSPRRSAQSRASPVVRHQHQHQSQGHDVYLAGGAAEPAPYMSPLRHSKSLPADLNCAEKAEPVPPPMRIVQRTASQPPARLSKRPSLQLLQLDSQALNFQYNLTKVLDFLYIGSEEIPGQTQLLRSQNITHIVNASCHAYYEQPEQGLYVRLDLKDEVDEQIRPKLDMAFSLIESARKQSTACIVHCRHGMSRSAAVAIAYLMRFQGMTLIDAFKFVRDRRPCISPNPGFMRQLAELERELFNGVTTLDVQRYEDDRFGDIHNLTLPRQQQQQQAHAFPMGR